jgi:hypothetical protein
MQSRQGNSFESIPKSQQSNQQQHEYHSVAAVLTDVIPTPFTVVGR